MIMMVDFTEMHVASRFGSSMMKIVVSEVVADVSKQLSTTKAGKDFGREHSRIKNIEEGDNGKGRRRRED